MGYDTPAYIKTLAGSGQGSSVMDSGASKLFRAGIARRNTSPAIVVVAGASSSAGEGMTIAQKKPYNRLGAYLQSAYPLDSGAASPALVTSIPGSPGNGVQVVNLAFSGSYSADFLTSGTGGRGTTSIGDLNPVAVFMQCVMNDYTQQLSPSTAASRIISRASEIQARVLSNTGRKCPVFFIGWQTRIDSPSSPAVGKFWDDYLTPIKTFVNDNPDTTALIDLRKWFEPLHVGYGTGNADEFDLISSDNAHLTEAGYAFVADRILREVLGVIVIGGSVGLGDVTAPTTPTGFAFGTMTSTTAPCSWTNGTDANGIDHSEVVYQVNGAGAWLTWPVAGNASSTTITGLAAGQSIEGYVRNYDPTGNVSAASTHDTKSTTGTADVTAPTPPTISFVSKTSTTITVTASGSTDAVGVTGYNFYNNDVKANDTLDADGTYTFTGLTPNTPYAALKATAMDAAGNESTKSSALASVTTDAAPTLPTVVASAQGSNGSTRSPTVTFSSYTPQLGDIVLIGCNTNSAASTFNNVTGWTAGKFGSNAGNPQSSGWCLHIVDATDVANNTTTYTATNMLGGAATVRWGGGVIRGGSVAAGFDAVAGSGVNTASTTHTAPALAGADLSSNSLILIYAGTTTTTNYSDPSGWTNVIKNPSGGGSAWWRRNTGSSAGVDVPTTDVTADSNSRYVTGTIAIAAA